MVGGIVEKYGSKKRSKLAVDNIELIEKMIGFKLPEDYRQFAEGYTGFESIIGEEFVRLWDSDELMESNSDYMITGELENTIGIGTNGGGEVIAIEKIEKDKFRIVLSPLIDLDKRCHVEIGESFTEFLVRLENGKEWFD